MTTWTLDDLKLDHSYASIDRVEERFVESLVENRDLALKVEGYLGDTLVERAGGVLGRGKSKVLSDQWTVAFSNKSEFAPKNVVKRFLSYQGAGKRQPGFLRDETERYDLSLQRRSLDALRASERETLVALGTLAKVDLARSGSSEALDAVEGVLAASLRGPIEAHRSALHGVALYLGELGCKTHGLDWAVDDNPKSTDYGHWRVGTWALIPTIRKCLHEAAGTLREHVEAALGG